MELGIVVVIGALLSVPVGLIVLAGRQSEMRRRLEELEGKLRWLETKLASAPTPVDSPTPLADLLGTRREARVPEPVSEPLEPLFPTPPPPPTPSVQLPPLIAPLPQFATETALPASASTIAPLAETTTDLPEPAKVVDWEKFLGVKLFAWVGGLALFLGIALFIRYSFEHNLISPAMRVALGFLTGIGLLTGGVLLKRKEYAVTAQSLCATGVVALYAVSFAAHAAYQLIGPGTVFSLMSAITAVAFFLAVRMDARVVAVLGLAGGFLTPPLLSGGQDNPLGLFGYVTLLNGGLLAVALHRRWHFLSLLGAIGTALMELGWVLRFFEPEKSWTLLIVLALFNAIFVSAVFLSERFNQTNRESIMAALGQGAVGFLALLFVVAKAGMESRPGVFLAIVLIADLPFLLLPLARNSLFRVQAAGGGAALTLLAVWIQSAFRESNLFWALGATLLFAILHSVYPLLLQRHRNLTLSTGWIDLFPLGSIALMLLTLLHVNLAFAIWPAIFLLDLLVIGLAVLSGSLLGALGAVLMTAVFSFAWILRLPSDFTGGSSVFILGIFAGFFIAASTWLARRTAALGDAEDQKRKALQRYLPALSAILPFFLLLLLIAHLPALNVSTVFALGFVLSALLLWLGTRAEADELHLAALGASLFLQFFWRQLRFSAENSATALLWHLAFYALFTAYPFIFRQVSQRRLFPWISAALAGPLHFFFIYKACASLLPDFAAMGLIPAALALPALAGLFSIAKRFGLEEQQRSRLLALFGASALFFITLIFPIQFSRQWLTLGWALEGVALLWLFRRAPQRWLILTGTALLVVAFARLALNPAVFNYYPRGEARIFNWYLYSYGLVTACLLIGARLAPSGSKFLNSLKVQPLLYTLGAILAFLLLNVQIADFFAQGNFLTFEFSGNFARDMTYSIAWGLFALGLLLVGIFKQQPAVRYASLALLGVTLLKLFIHDLSQLGQLYRIGAFIGVAIILMLASFIYQKFIAATSRQGG